MDGKLIVFDDLVRCVIDDVATPEEFQDLVDMMRADVTLQRRYCDQMQIHALLTCHKGQEWQEDGEVLTGPNSNVRELGKTRAGGRRAAVGNRWRRNGWWKVAAALLLLGGGAVWYAADVRVNHEEYGVRRELAAEERVPAVRLVSQKGVKGLDLPVALPGTVRLASGEVVVKMQSGVELTVLGPCELEVRDCMQVRLEQGRLLVHVPQWATGFTVLTRELEIYDLGTVFSVSVDESVSGVFVFKGSVQVNETGEGWSGTAPSGEGVGICEAGEGVLIKAGEMPVRFVADHADALKLFGQVKGCAALKNPERALQAVREIADLWAERYVPGLALTANSRSRATRGPSRNRPGGRSPAASTTGRPSACSSQKLTDLATAAGCGSQTAGTLAVTATQASELYYSASGGGHDPWGAVESWRVYQSSGGGPAGHVPTRGNAVRINAATLAAENGNALVIGDGVNAECGSFASGYHDYPGTANLRLAGGSLTSQTTTVIGMYYPGLATFESGSLYSGTDFYIGGYGGYNGRGVVTNNGARIDVLKLHVGHEKNTFGRLVHNGGSLSCRAANTNASLQVGFNGGVGEFEANAGFSAYAMGIGNRTTADGPFGTGTVTVSEGALGAVRHVLRVRNGALFMRGGTIRLESSNRTSTNLFVRQEADGRALIRGWGRFTGAEEGNPLRMINNGVIVADGEGTERDLDFNALAVVNNDIPNGSSGANGWYAVNRGRVMLPRTYRTFSPATTYCWGDLYTKTAPELVNSVAFAFASQVNCAIRGAFCASDRSDIPAGRPEHLRPVGVWCIGAYSDKLLLTQASFAAVSLTFRYDQAQLKATDSKLRLYRHDGSAWVRVGSCLPGGDNRISTEAPLAPLAAGDYNIGWFALMAEERNGTVLSIF
jgi:hypothetical protein